MDASYPEQVAPDPWRADVELARRARAGNPAAVDELLARIGCVRRFQRVKNLQLGRPLGKHELEDLLQETLFALWQKLDLYAGLGSLEAWAYRFATLRLLARVRKLRARPRLIEDLWDGVPEPQAPPIEDADRFEHLYRTLERLAPRDRDLIRLKTFDQRTFEHIALLLDLPVATVKTRFYRALSRLRELLGSPEAPPTLARGRRR